MDSNYYQRIYVLVIYENTIWEELHESLAP